VLNGTYGIVGREHSAYRLGFQFTAVGGNYRVTHKLVYRFIVVSWSYRRADGSHGSTATSRGSSGANL
jgi:hypothetical protein